MVGDTPAIACAKGAAAETPGAQFSEPTRRDALTECNAALADKIGGAGSHSHAGQSRHHLGGGG